MANPNPSAGYAHVCVCNAHVCVCNAKKKERSIRTSRILPEPEPKHAHTRPRTREGRRFRFGFGILSNACFRFRLRLWRGTIGRLSAGRTANGCPVAVTVGGMVEAGRGKRDAANGCPVGRHRNATGRGGESGRARTRPNGANATAGGCGAFGANLSADCRRHGCGDCPNPSADYPNRITANGCPELGTVAARQTIRTRHPSEPVTVGGTEEAGRGEPLPVPVRTRDRSRTCHRRRHGGNGTRRTRRQTI